MIKLDGVEQNVKHNINIIRLKQKIMEQFKNILNDLTSAPKKYEHEHILLKDYLMEMCPDKDNFAGNVWLIYQKYYIVCHLVY